MVMARLCLLLLLWGWVALLLVCVGAGEVGIEAHCPTVLQQRCLWTPHTSSTPTTVSDIFLEQWYDQELFVHWRAPFTRESNSTASALLRVFASHCHQSALGVDCAVPLHTYFSADSAVVEGRVLLPHPVLTCHYDRDGDGNMTDAAANGNDGDREGNSAADREGNSAADSAAGPDGAGRANDAEKLRVFGHMIPPDVFSVALEVTAVDGAVDSLDPFRHHRRGNHIVVHASAVTPASVAPVCRVSWGQLLAGPADSDLANPEGALRVWVGTLKLSPVMTEKHALLPTRCHELPVHRRRPHDAPDDDRSMGQAGHVQTGPLWMWPEHWDARWSLGLFTPHQRSNGDANADENDIVAHLVGMEHQHILDSLTCQSALKHADARMLGVCRRQRAHALLTPSQLLPAFASHQSEDQAWWELPSKIRIEHPGFLAPLDRADSDGSSDGTSGTDSLNRADELEAPVAGLVGEVERVWVGGDGHIDDVSSFFAHPTLITWSHHMTAPSQDTDVGAGDDNTTDSLARGHAAEHVVMMGSHPHFVGVSERQQDSPWFFAHPFTWMQFHAEDKLLQAGGSVGVDGLAGGMMGDFRAPSIHHDSSHICVPYSARRPFHWLFDPTQHHNVVNRNGAGPVADNGAAPTDERTITCYYDAMLPYREGHLREVSAWRASEEPAPAAHSQTGAPGNTVFLQASEHASGPDGAVNTTSPLAESMEDLPQPHYRIERVPGRVVGQVDGMATHEPFGEAVSRALTAKIQELAGKDTQVHLTGDVGAHDKPFVLVTGMEPPKPPSGDGSGSGSGGAGSGGAGAGGNGRPRKKPRRRPPRPPDPRDLARNPAYPLNKRQAAGLMVPPTPTISDDDGGGGWCDLQNPFGNPFCPIPIIWFIFFNIIIKVAVPGLICPLVENLAEDFLQGQGAAMSVLDAILLETGGSVRVHNASDSDVAGTANGGAGDAAGSVTHQYSAFFRDRLDMRSPTLATAGDPYGVVDSADSTQQFHQQLTDTLHQHFQRMDGRSEHAGRRDRDWLLGEVVPSHSADPPPGHILRMHMVGRGRAGIRKHRYGEIEGEDHVSHTGSETVGSSGLEHTTGASHMSAGDALGAPAPAPLSTLGSAFRNHLKRAVGDSLQAGGLDAERFWQRHVQLHGTPPDSRRQPTPEEGDGGLGAGQDVSVASTTEDHSTDFLSGVAARTVQVVRCVTGGQGAMDQCMEWYAAAPGNTSPYDQSQHQKGLQDGDHGVDDGSVGGGGGGGGGGGRGLTAAEILNQEMGHVTDRLIDVMTSGSPSYSPGNAPSHTNTHAHLYPHSEPTGALFREKLEDASVHHDSTHPPAVHNQGVEIGVPDAESRGSAQLAGDGTAVFAEMGAAVTQNKKKKKTKSASAKQSKRKRKILVPLMTQMLYRSLVHPVTGRIAVPLSYAIADATILPSFAMVEGDVRDFLLESVPPALVRAVGPAVGLTVGTTVPELIERLLPASAVYMLTLHGIRTLTPAVVHSSASTLLHTLTHSPEAFLYCHHCAHGTAPSLQWSRTLLELMETPVPAPGDGPADTKRSDPQPDSCLMCARLSKVALSEAYYFLNYYSRYYSDYYTGVYEKQVWDVMRTARRYGAARAEARAGDTQ